MESTKTSPPVATSTAATTAATTGRASLAPPVIVLDMKSMSRKKLRRLRKGRGNAMAEMSEALDEFRQNGTIDPNAQVVIAIVKRKDRRPQSIWSR